MMLSQNQVDILGSHDLSAFTSHAQLQEKKLILNKSIII